MWTTEEYWTLAAIWTGFGFVLGMGCLAVCLAACGRDYEAEERRNAASGPLICAWRKHRLADGWAPVASAIRPGDAV